MAPEIFGRLDANGLSFVRRQPQNTEETALVEEILAGCATSSIGNDGDPS
jgi:ferredoxin